MNAMVLTRVATAPTLRGSRAPGAHADVDRRRQDAALEHVAELAELCCARDRAPVPASRRARSGTSGYRAMSSAAGRLRLRCVVPSVTNARISTRSSTPSSASRMLSATSPKSPKANSEKAIVVTLSALRSGARRTERIASRRASLTTDPRWRACPTDAARAPASRTRSGRGPARWCGSPCSADELEVVRRHEHRRARGVDVAQQLEDAARRAFVEVAGRLVGDEHERIVHERARDRDALLLAARELARE